MHLFRFSLISHLYEHVCVCMIVHLTSAFVQIIQIGLVTNYSHSLLLYHTLRFFLFSICYFVGFCFLSVVVVVPFVIKIWNTHTLNLAKFNDVHLFYFICIFIVVNGVEWSGIFPVHRTHFYIHNEAKVVEYSKWNQFISHLNFYI